MLIFCEGSMGISLGLKGGINYSTVYDENDPNFSPSPKVGAAFGGFLTLPFGFIFAAQPEIMFSQKGYIATGRIDNNNYDYIRTTTHIDVPLMLQLRLFKVMAIMAGPNYSYLISKSEKFRSGDISYSQEQIIRNDNLRKNTLGIIGGIDINVAHMVIGARAAWDSRQNNGDGTSYTPRYKNFFYQATIGFRF